VTKILKSISFLGMLLLACGVTGGILQTIFKLPPLSIPTSSTMSRFASATNHYAISYPEDWFFQETPNGIQGNRSIVAIIDFPKLPPPGVRVTIQRSSEHFDSLMQASEWAESIRRTEQAYRVISSENRVLKEEMVLESVIYFELPATPLQSVQPMKCLGHYRLHKRIAYALTFCAQADDFSNLETTFRHMIDSISYQD
jgi:hypothetical protein